MRSNAFKVLVSICVWGCSHMVVGAESEPLSLEAKISLGGIEGRIDHLAFDPKRERVVIAELGNNTIGVVDLKGHKLIRTLTGFRTPTGIAYSAKRDVIYAATGGDGYLHVLKGEELSILRSIRVGDDADNVRVDPITEQIIVGYGDGALAIIDADTLQIVARVQLKGHPESFQLRSGSNQIIVNVPDAHEIAIIDRTSNQQIQSIPTGGLSSNYPLALGSNDDTALSVFRKPARLGIVDLKAGKFVGTVEIGGDADDIFMDSKRRRVYISCGEGFVDTLKEQGGAYKRVHRFKTITGARTALFIPERDLLVVAARAEGKEPAAVWVLRAQD
jgi:hypothetical protein